MRHASVAERVRERRVELGLRVKDVAGLSGLSTSTINRIEGGKSTFYVRVETAMLLAEALQCEIHELFDRYELSRNGRPPKTGGSRAEVTHLDDRRKKSCPSCFIQKPASMIVCDECDTALVAA